MTPEWTYSTSLVGIFLRNGWPYAAPTVVTHLNRYERLRVILTAILDADERGQAVGYAEALDEAKRELGR